MKKLFTPAVNKCCIALMVILVAGCLHYRKKNTDENPLPLEAQRPNNFNYVTLHLGNEAWHLTEIKYDTEKAIVTGQLSAPGKREMEIYNRFSSKRSIRINNGTERSEYDRQLHVFVSSMKTSGDSVKTCEIADSSFVRLEYFDTDRGRAALVTTAIVAGSLGAAFGGLVLICGCPMVYTYSDTALTFHGGLFPGSLSHNVARYDVLPLNDTRDGGNTFSLEIRGKKDEHQYLDEVSVLSVQHPKGTTAMFDRHMNAYAVSSVQTPLTVVSENGVDHKTDVQVQDGSPYAFTEPTNEDHFNDLYVTFANENHNTNAKLILNAGNTGWSGYMFEQAMALYGKQYPKFAKLSAIMPAETKTERLQEQGMLLSVYIRKNNQWVFADYLPIAGTIYRNAVIPIDLTGISQHENVEIMLRSGYRIWNIDQVAIDYSADVPVTISTVQPFSAIDANGNDLLSRVLKTDDDYSEHQGAADYTALKFQLPNRNDTMNTSLFVKGFGYYTQTSRSDEPADLKAVRQFNQPGGFSAFSEKRFLLLEEKMGAFSAQ